MTVSDGRTRLQRRSPAPKPFALHRFSGTPTEVGRQHGEECRDLIAIHLDAVLAQVGVAGSNTATLAEAVMQFRPWVQHATPHLDEEVVGLSEGADISLEHAYLLQLRAEVAAELRRSSPDGTNECTTFSIHRDATATGVGLIGQNADLPAFYRDLMIVVQVRPTAGPDVLMMTPAGQISYGGISASGMGVAANFLHCDGWRDGYPRYLLSRYVLAHDSIDAVRAGLCALRRASSRNLMIMDRGGEILCLENTPTQLAELRPVDGVLTHANHYMSPQLLDEERAKPSSLRNSRARQRRIDMLMTERAGDLSPQSVSAIMRDREDAPDALSRTAQDCDQANPSWAEEITVASFIAEPSAGRMWVSAGPPSESPYYEYSFDRGLQAQEAL